MFWLLLLIVCVLALNWQIAVIVILLILIISNPIWLIPIAFIMLAVYYLKESEK